MIKFKFIRFILPILLLFFIGNTLILKSQPIEINGKAEGQHNTLVRILVHDDEFTNLKKTIASTFTDDQGFFSLSTEFPETTYAHLAVGLKKGEFYLKPGSKYQFNVLPDTIKKRGSVFDELPLQFTFEADDNGLNEAIGSFNFKYNQFLIENSNSIYRSRDKSLITAFKEQVEIDFKDVNNKFFKNYLSYTMASLEWLSKQKKDQQIISEYFLNKPVLYQNIQYSEFLADLFKAYYASTDLFNYDDVVAAINSEKGYIRIDRLLQLDELIKTDTELRELVAMLLLARKYYSPNVRKEKVISIYRELHRNSKFPGIRKVAENYVTKLQQLEYGTPAPSFALLDANQSEVELSRFEGKFVVLNFNRGDCKLCQHYLQNLGELKKEFVSSLEIISIISAEGYAETLEYAQERSFDWTFLNLGNNILVLEDYNIRAYPSFIIINPDNSIAMATAPLPGEGLELYIKRYMNKYNRIQEGKSAE